MSLGLSQISEECQDFFMFARGYHGSIRVQVLASLVPVSGAMIWEYFPWTSYFTQCKCVSTFSLLSFRFVNECLISFIHSTSWCAYSYILQMCSIPEHTDYLNSEGMQSTCSGHYVHPDSWKQTHPWLNPAALSTLQLWLLLCPLSCFELENKHTWHMQFPLSVWVKHRKVALSPWSGYRVFVYAWVCVPICTVSAWQDYAPTLAERLCSELTPGGCLYRVRDCRWCSQVGMATVEFTTSPH